MARTENTLAVSVRLKENRHDIELLAATVCNQDGREIDTLLLDGRRYDTPGLVELFLDWLARHEGPALLSADSADFVVNMEQLADEVGQSFVDLIEPHVIDLEVLARLTSTRLEHDPKAYPGLHHCREDQAAWQRFKKLISRVAAN